MELAELEAKDITELLSVAKELAIEDANELSKQDLVFRIMETETEKSGLIMGSGGPSTSTIGNGARSMISADWERSIGGAWVISFSIFSAMTLSALASSSSLCASPISPTTRPCL